MNKKLFSMAVLSIILLSSIGGIPVLAQSVSPASDFEYDLNGDGTGVVICKYKGQRKDVVIPSSIEDIPVVELDVRAFSGTDIVSVVIPNSVTDIGFYCFANCRYLQKALLPNTLTFLNLGVFQRCIALKNITLPESLEYIGIGAFAGSGLESITIPDKVHTIGAHNGGIPPFSDCVHLKSVTIGNGTEMIGWGAFGGCTSLTTVSIGSGIKAILGGAFAYCRNLTSFNIGVKKLKAGSTFKLYGGKDGRYHETGYINSVQDLDGNTHQIDIFVGCSALSLKEKKKIRDTGYTGGF